MSAPTTSIDSSTGGLSISWAAPSSGHETIDEYDVRIIKKSDGSLATYSNCIGTSIVLSLKCIVPMTELTTTLGYSFRDLVEV